jgi:hypothetical protein
MRIIGKLKTKAYERFKDHFGLTEASLVDDPIRIDVMADDTNPNEVSIENAYKTRWIWYHTILAIGIFMTNILLIAILLLLGIKL